MSEDPDEKFLWITILSPVVGGFVGFATGRLWLVALGWIIVLSGLFWMVATSGDSHRELLEYLENRRSNQTARND